MAKPIIKWVGGKAGLLPQLLPLLPDGVSERRYIEPFFGGGALFFELEPEEAYLSDVNTPLMHMYYCVKSDPKGMLRRLRRLLSAHSDKNYYLNRHAYNHGNITVQQRAALFLYLNKRCFNGLYRENKKGEFNASVGSYKEVKADAVAIVAAAKALRFAEVHNQSFEKTATEVQTGDFVYFDPPYDGAFTTYTREGFTKVAQKRLADMFAELSRQRDVKLMLSNANTPLIRKLYGGFNISKILAPRSINRDGAGRKKVSELVIRNY